MFNPQIWSAETQRLMNEELKIKKRIVSTVVDYTALAKGKKADAYNGPSLGDVTVYDMPISSGNFQALAENDYNLPFDIKKGVPVMISDIDDAMSVLATRKVYTSKAKDGLLDGYDTTIIEKIITGVNSSQKITKADTSGNKISEADFKAARKLLNKAGAPLKERYAVVNVDDESELTSIPNFVSRDKIADSVAIKEGVVGRIHGFDVIMFSDMPLVNSGGALSGTQNKKVNVFYQKNVLGFGRQKEFGVKIQPQAGSASDLLNTYSVYGAKMHTGKDKYAVTVRDN
jgi:hypothetical protein